MNSLNLKISSIKKNRDKQSGIALFEFSLTLPILFFFLVIFGIIGYRLYSRNIIMLAMYDAGRRASTGSLHDKDFTKSISRLKELLILNAKTYGVYLNEKYIILCPSNITNCTNENFTYQPLGTSGGAVTITTYNLLAGTQMYTYINEQF
jgi:hypothetical protein